MWARELAKWLSNNYANELAEWFTRFRHLAPVNQNKVSFNNEVYETKAEIENGPIKLAKVG